MSIKKKLVTAVTTAGLLAGIFGSAFAPVAQAATATLDKAEFMGTLKGSTYGDWQDFAWGDANEASGSASSPYVIYSPEYNDGGSASSAVSQAICVSVDVTDIEDVMGNDMSDQDDVSFNVTATGGLLIDGFDESSPTFSNDEGDYAASYTDNNVVTAAAACFAVNSDDVSGSSVVTFKINGVVAGAINIKIVGPATKFAPSSRMGEYWVAMDNYTIEDAIMITFTDASNNNLWTSLRDSSGYTNGDGGMEAGVVCDDLGFAGDVLDCITAYFGTGVEAYDDGGYHLVDPAIDYVATGDNWDELDGLDLGSADRYFDIYEYFCDSSRDEVGGSHNVYFGLDQAGGGTRTSSDIVLAPIAIKCSDDGFFAEITGLNFGTATTVEAGDTIPMYLQIGDGSGNPQGAGSQLYDVPGGGVDEFGGLDETNSGYPYFENFSNGDPAFSFYPSHTQSDDADYFDNRGTTIELEAISDDNTSCGAPYTEEGDTLGENATLLDYIVGHNVDAGDDAPASAGTVMLCYSASQLPEDLGYNTVKLRVEYPWTDFAYDYLGTSPKSFLAGITVVKPGALASAGAVAFGKTVSANANGKVTVAGPVGSKVTFVVENARGIVRTYNRVVGASGKASYRIKTNGTFYVYAMSGDDITSVKKVRVR